MNAAIHPLRYTTEQWSNFKKLVKREKKKEKKVFQDDFSYMFQFNFEYLSQLNEIPISFIIESAWLDCKFNLDGDFHNNGSSDFPREINVMISYSMHHLRVCNQKRKQFIEFSTSLCKAVVAGDC